MYFIPPEREPITKKDAPLIIGIVLCIGAVIGGLVAYDLFIVPWIDAITGNLPRWLHWGIYHTARMLPFLAIGFGILKLNSIFWFRGSYK